METKMYTHLACHTPFQTGGLLRSVINLLWAGIWFAMLGDTTMGGGEKFVAVLVGLALTALVLNRILTSRFYTAIPVEVGARAANRVHDVLGTIGIFFIIAMIWLFRIVLDALAGTSTSSGGLGSGGKKTAISADGVIYKKSFWTGSWEPEQGLFGPKTDRGLFGPHIKQGLFGPVEKRDGFWHEPQQGADGANLYERRQ
jgi:hypothetical protein